MPGAVATSPRMQIPRTPGVTLLDFTAAWCAPCKVLKPVLDEVGKEHGAAVVMVDVDDHPDLAQQYLVKSMPTVVLLRDGQEVGRFVGSRSKAFVGGVVRRAVAGDVAIAAP